MRISKRIRRNFGFIKSSIRYGVVLLAAMGLKYHYSHASSDDLVWILAPTAGMVEQISGIRFEKEIGTGYVNRECRIIIAASCAGVNFLIIAFCMTAFSGLTLLRHSRSKSFCLVKSAACAYLLTIVTNAFRIVVSIYTVQSDIFSGPLTPARIHRIEGIFIYFFFLSLFYLIVQKIIHHSIRDETRKTKNFPGKDLNYLKMAAAPLIPFFWYTLMGIGIPFLNGAYRKKGAQFTEHFWVVLSVCAVVFLLIFLIQLCCRRTEDKIPT